MHCAVAVQRSIIEYFTGRTVTWEYVEKLAGFQKGKAAWTVDIWTRLAKQGFDIRMVEPFDYRAFAERGVDYLREIYSPEEVEWQLKNSNILELKQFDTFLEIVKPECRRPALDDIDAMLAEGRLVFVTLNSRALNDKPGYASHAVLVLRAEGDDYIIHDPGLPPQPNRRVPKQKLFEAMGGEKSNSEATGIKLKNQPVRADVLLAAMYPEYSRAALAKLFDDGLVSYRGKKLKAGDKVPSGAALEADLSRLETPPADIDLPILYEDDNCIVIDKPVGVLTHALGIHGNEPSVASFIRSRVTGMDGERAGVVHRLDRATSGVIICAKNQAALSALQKQFAQRKAKKTYVAVVEGRPNPEEAIIDMPIERNPKAPATFRVGPNGKSAKTHYKVLKTGKKYSLVELKPETGRTHQLRVHLAKIGRPIVGDPLYGHGKYGDRLYLHALNLEITIPGGERKTFTAPLPKEFEEQVDG